MRTPCTHRNTLMFALALVASAGLAISAYAGQPGHRAHHPPQSGPVANTEHGVPVVVDAPPVEPTDGPVIQLALLLDTSNSMDGLINQAKTRLWSVVNELSRARHHGAIPQLQVALYEYGNDALESSDGYIRRRVAFTTDLDILSEQLFSLTTNGGSEFCGWAIDDAVHELAWIATDVEPIDELINPRDDKPLDEQADDAFVEAMKGGHHHAHHDRHIIPRLPDQSVVRMIVIAGNEPFTQGAVSYREAIADAVDAGVIVNTIHCGSHDEGAQTGWKDGAILGNGRYTSIDHNRSVVAIATPFDDRMSQLNLALNDTYIPYGAMGAVASSRQEEQDGFNAKEGALMDRVTSKASAMYRNASWDLVDAVNEGAVTLASLKAEDLPENLRDMTKDELGKYIESMNDKRATVRDAITEVAAQRAQFIATNTPDDPKAAALHEALVQMLHEQCEAQGFVFEDAEVTTESP